MAKSGGQGPDRGGSDRRGNGQPRGQKSTGKGRTGGKPSSGASRGKSKGSSSSGSATRRSSEQRKTRGQDPRKRTGSSSHERNDPKARRRDLRGAAANLPNWVVEALARVTPEKRVGDALTALGEASEAFAEGSYQRAVRKAEQAKSLSPRDTTVREVLGLAAYRLGDWQKALAELRAFRRMAGETTHLPVEIDVLRALGRDRDVEAAWTTLQERGGKAPVMKEGAVVYASHLIDQGDLDRARTVVGSRRPTTNPFPEDLRLWYVAARVAALQGDADGAVRMRNAILEHDPAFPGIDELETLIARI